MLGDGPSADLDGMPPDMAAQIETELERRREHVEVWPENHEAVTVFARCRTQWRRGMTGAPQGLDYLGVECVMRLCSVADPSDCFDRLQTMEMAVLTAITERQE